MNTKLLQSSSAIVMALFGISATFLPHEILNSINISPIGFTPLLLQAAGALYVGFAMMNWMSKNFIIGGIYSRPIVMANFTHFMVGSMALIKGSIDGPSVPFLWMIAATYSIFAVLYSVVLFRHPVKQTTHVL